MISLIEINSAINNTIINSLKNTEFNNVPLIAEDLKEPIQRPSIKVQLEDSDSGKFNNCNKERTLTIRVYFFAKDKDKPKIDNIKMRGIIEDAFILKALKVTDDFFIDIPSVDSHVSDGVLICSFELETLELIPEEVLDGREYELMENLDFDFKED